MVGVRVAKILPLFESVVGARSLRAGTGTY